MFRWGPACLDIHSFVVVVVFVVHVLELAGHEGFDLQIVDETGKDGRVVCFPIYIVPRVGYKF